MLTKSKAQKKLEDFEIVFKALAHEHPAVAEIWDAMGKVANFQK